MFRFCVFLYHFLLILCLFVAFMCHFWLFHSYIYYSFVAICGYLYVFVIL